MNFDSPDEAHLAENVQIFLMNQSIISEEEYMTLNQIKEQTRFAPFTEQLMKEREISEQEQALEYERLLKIMRGQDENSRQRNL